MNVTLRQLRAFVEVGKRRSFTSAARHLHLTQSALSHLIRQLETQLAVRLIGAFHYLVDRAASQAGVPVAPAYEVGYMGTAIGTPTVAREVSIVTRAGRTLSPAAAQFAEVLRTLCA